MGFLTFIFVLLVVIWFVGLVARGLLARWLRKRTDEYNRRAKEAQKEARRAARNGREGEVTIEAQRTTFRKKVSRNVGDYVDFEEITEVTEETKTR
jgi:hypothetical protein